MALAAEGEVAEFVMCTTPTNEGISKRMTGNLTIACRPCCRKKTLTSGSARLARARKAAEPAYRRMKTKVGGRWWAEGRRRMSIARAGKGGIV